MSDHMLRGAAEHQAPQALVTVRSQHYQVGSQGGGHPNDFFLRSPFAQSTLTVQFQCFGLSLKFR